MCHSWPISSTLKHSGALTCFGFTTSRPNGRGEASPAWADASPAEVDHALLLADIDNGAFTAALKILGDTRPRPLLLDLTKRQAGIKLLYKFAWLSYERSKRLDDPKQQEPPRPAGAEPRKAATIEELLSDDWPGYSPRLDPVMTHP